MSIFDDDYTEECKKRHDSFAKLFNEGLLVFVPNSTSEYIDALNDFFGSSSPNEDGVWLHLLIQGILFTSDRKLLSIYQDIAMERRIYPLILDLEFNALDYYKVDNMKGCVMEKTYTIIKMFLIDQGRNQTDKEILCLNIEDDMNSFKIYYPELLESAEDYRYKIDVMEDYNERLLADISRLEEEEDECEPPNIDNYLAKISRLKSHNQEQSDAIENLEYEVQSLKNNLKTFSDYFVNNIQIWECIINKNLYSDDIVSLVKTYHKSF